MVRDKKIDIKDIEDTEIYELDLSDFGENDFSIQFNKGFDIKFSKLKHDLVFSFTDKELGSNRTCRKLKLADGERVENMKIFVDTCSIEIFINDGIYTYTTKYFKAKGIKNWVSFEGSIESIKAYSLRPFNINI